MIKKEMKRGQFFLAAAIIIVIILFGVFSVSNYVKKEEKKTIVYDLKKEFGLEGGKVIDWTIYHGEDSSEFIKNWTILYMSEKERSLDNFVVVYGNSTSIFKVNLVETGGASIGESWIVGNKIAQVTRLESEVEGEVEKKIEVHVDSQVYKFDLEPGKSFIFIIREGGYFEKSD